MTDNKEVHRYVKYWNFHQETAMFMVQKNKRQLENFVRKWKLKSDLTILKKSK